MTARKSAHKYDGHGFALLTINTALLGLTVSIQSPGGGSEMLKSMTVVLVAFTLGGCAVADFSSHERLPANSLAWDGLGPDPIEPTPVPGRRKIATKKRTDPASAMASMRDDDAEIAAVPKYSKEWVALWVAKQERDDAKLDRAIAICRGC